MIRAAIIAPDSDIRYQMEQLVAPLRHIFLVRRWDRYPSTSETSRFLRATGTQLIFLSVEHLDAAAMIVEHVSQHAPATQFVAIDRCCELETLRRLARLGVREVVTLPATPETVGESLGRLSAVLEQEAPPEPGAPLFTFLPCKAGVGASTTAVQVSHAMCREPDSQVLLADFDLNNGVLGVMLGLHARHTIAELADAGAEIDEMIWPKLVSSIGRLDILQASDFDPSQRIEFALLRDLVEYARRMYEAVCIDLSGNMEKYSLELMHDSNQIVLVCGADIPSIHLARQKLKLLQRLELTEQVRVVLNEAHNPAGMTEDELEKLLGVKVSLSLPNDRCSVDIAMRRGKFVPPSCLLGQRYGELAGSLLGRPGKSPEPRGRLRDYLKMGA
jgi:Flp pilus assembly CpaE family ATPase